MTAQQRLSQFRFNSPAQPSAQGINVAFVLEKLAREFPQTEPKHLDILCRKIAVTKGLSGRYGEHWKREDHQPLSQEHWNLLITLLLAEAEKRLETQDVRARAVALKYLDTAAKALDLRQDSGEARGLLAGLLDALL